MMKFKLISFHHLNSFNLKSLKIALGLILTIVVPSILSATTIDDLKFTLINGDTEYSVSAVDPSAITGAMAIPASHEGKPVTEIGAYGFGGEWDARNHKITSITIPSSIQVIGDSAFQYCEALTTVTFAEDSQLSTIEPYAFFYCTSLTSIQLPDSLTELKADVFNSCASLTSVNIPSGVTVISDSLFAFCSSLSSIILHDAITEIGRNAFQATGLTEITIPASVTHFGKAAFAQTSQLKTVTFLGSAPSLDTLIFYDAGKETDGLNFVIYDTHQESFASWRDQNGNPYTYQVVTEHTEPVVLALEVNYNAATKVLNILTKDEPSGATLNFEHTNAIDGTWTTLSEQSFVKSDDADSGTVTRSLTLDTATHPQGYYRIVSASTP
jgi:hypothetical protein